MQICSAIVDVIPIFLGGSINMPIDDKDLEISYLSSEKQYAHDNRTKPAVSIHHIPSGITVQSSGTLSLQLHSHLLILSTCASLVS